MSCSPEDINLQSFLPFYHLDDISYKLALGQKKISGFPVSSYKNLGRVGRF
jgi:hypothetical protein